MSSFKVVIMFLFLSLLGLFVIPSLPIDLLPSKTAPIFTISYTLPDAPPEVLEREATAPLENVLSQLSQIKNIYSISGYNEGSIQVTFNTGVNQDFKKFEIASAIRHVYPKLNNAISYPIIDQRSRKSETQKVLLSYRVNAKLAPYQLKKTATDVFKTELSRINGIKEVQITGGEEIQLSIDYNPDKLKQFKVSPQIVLKSISETFQTSFPGLFKTNNGQRFSIKAENRFDDIQQLNLLKIKTDSSYILLKDLATIYFEESQPRQYFRINGDNSVSLNIYADEAVNRIVLARNIKTAITKLSTNLPAGFRLQLEYDDTEFLVKEINKNLIRSGMAVVILLLFIILTYRTWKNLVLLSASILVNLLISLLILKISGVSIHLYTLAGLTISFGLLIDNAIVMLDHLSRKSTTRIATAILGATFTTVLALLLVFLLPEEDQQNLAEFCKAAAVTLTVSIFTTIFFLPAVYKLLTKNSKDRTRNTSIKYLRTRTAWFLKYQRLITFLSQYKKFIVLAVVLAFGIPVFLLPAKWEGKNWYNQTIGSYFYQEKIRPYSDLALGGALRLFVRNVYERSGYRTPEKTRLYVNAALPHGHTLQDMNLLLQKIEHYLGSVSGINKYITHVVSGERGYIEITFNPSYEDGALPYQIKSRLIARSLDLGGADWNIYGVGRGFSNSSGESLSNFKVEMRGYNFVELDRQTKILADALLQHKRIQKVNTNERLSWNEKSIDELTLQIDRYGLGLQGLNPQQIATILSQKATQNYPAMWLTDHGQQIPAFLQAGNANQFSTYQLLTDPIESGETMVRWGNFANLTRQRTANAIHKENRQYIRQIGFNYYGSFQIGDKYLNETLSKVIAQMPTGYTAKKIMWSFDWNKIKRQYELLLLLVAGIYILCAILFESFKLSLYIILSIPFSLIGLFLAFGMFDFYFDQGGYAAFVLLGGLVVNSTILIVNYLVQLKMRTNRSILKLITYKLKPISLTIFSICLSLAPFMMGGQTEVFWFALALGTIGGLLFSILYMTLILPVFFKKK